MQLSFTDISGKFLYLVMRTADGGRRKSVYKVGLGAREILAGKAEKYRKKGMDYLRAHGGKGPLGKGNAKSLRN